MQQKKLRYNPAAKAIPKAVACEVISMTIGALCIVFVPDIGLYLGIVIIVCGIVLGVSVLVWLIAKVPCPDCGRVTQLEKSTQIRTCTTCAVEWTSSE